MTEPISAPLVSVVIPYFQREAGLLKRCASSILDQTGYDNIEIIVVDDESPIPAETELGGNLSSSENIKLIKQKNAGAGAARNAGLDTISDHSKYVAFLDSDDWWEPNFLRTAIDTLEQGFDLFFCDTRREGFSDTRFQWHKAKNLVLNPYDHVQLNSSNDAFKFSGDFFDYAIERSNILSTSATIYRRSLSPDLRFDPTLFNGQDRLFKLGIAKLASGVAFSSSILVNEGKGVNIFDSSSWGSKDSLRLLHNYTKLCRKILKNFSLSQEQEKEIYKQLKETRLSIVASVLHLLRNRTEVNWKLVFKTLKVDPPFALHLIPNVIKVILKAFLTKKRR